MKSSELLRLTRARLAEYEFGFGRFVCHAVRLVSKDNPEQSGACKRIIKYIKSVLVHDMVLFCIQYPLGSTGPTGYLLANSHRKNV